jgi:hypothetical protein
MKYRLRFFLDNGKPMCEQYCFAHADTKHLPQDLDNVYIGDDMIDDKHGQGIETGIIYTVVERVFCFNHNNDTEDHLTNVEISLRKTNK